MIKHYKTFHVYTLALLFMLGIQVKAQKLSIPLKVEVQEQDQWCWAACSKSILQYYNSSFAKKQCEIVDYARTTKGDNYFGNQACCPKTTTCNKPNEIDFNYGIKGMLEHFGNIKSKTAGGLTAASVIKEMKAKRPVQMGVYWDQGGGHALVACAYDTAAKTMTMMDPWQNNGMTTTKYATGTKVNTNSGAGTWKESLVMLTDPATSTVSPNSEVSSQIRIFPNPTHLYNDVKILSHENIKSIKVLNALGQFVADYTNVQNTQFAVTLPAAGIYSIQVQTEGGFANKKIVVQ